jgi:hypothetical protein
MESVAANPPCAEALAQDPIPDSKRRWISLLTLSPAGTAGFLGNFHTR